MRIKNHADSTLIVEFSSHMQVLVPWLRQLIQEKPVVYVGDAIFSHANDYLHREGIVSELQRYESLKSMRKLLYGKVFKQQSYKIIVTSLPEVKTNPATWIAMVTVALLGVDILCIRNSGRWKLRNRSLHKFIKYSKNPLRSLGYIVSELLSFLIEKLVLFRSAGLVFETEHQRRIFGKKCRPDDKVLIFSGREMRKQSTENHRLGRKVSSNLTRGIGLLGTINTEKRNYRIVQEAVCYLKSIGHEVRVYFLGAWLNQQSDDVIQTFGNSVAFAPSRSETFVSEEEIADFIDLIDLFIAPLAGIHYENGGSTGAVADAQYWNKPLLMPLQVNSYFEGLADSFYENPVDLGNLILSTQKRPTDYPGVDLRGFLKRTKGCELN